MPTVTLIRGRSYSVAGKIFQINVPQDVREEFTEATKLDRNPQFRVQRAGPTESVAPVAPVAPVALSRAELKAKLTAAGVAFGGRTKTTTLRKLYAKL